MKYTNLKYQCKKLKNDIQDMQLIYDTANKPDLIYHNDYSLEFIKDKKIYNFAGSPAVVEYIKDTSDWIDIVGNFASGKSGGSIAKVLWRARNMPACADGIRRYHLITVRETYKQLLKTSFDIWMKWCGRLGKVSPHRSPPLSVSHIFKFRHNGESGIIKLSVDFLAVEGIRDIEDLKSYLTTDVYDNEGMEIDDLILETLAGRTGRYPEASDLPDSAKKMIDGNFVPIFPHGIFGDTNPPDEGHKIEEIEKTCPDISGNKEKNMYHMHKEISYYISGGKKKESVRTVIHQPPALLQKENGEWYGNKHAENISNIAGGYEYYFKRLTNGAQWIRVFIQGYFGEIMSDQVVHPEFNENIHVIQNIDIHKDYPVLFSWDYGKICPGCVLFQCVGGQIRVIKEWYGNIISVKGLYNKKIRMFVAKYLKEMEIYVIGDPANTGEGREQLEEIGYIVDNAPTNDVEVRINSVRNALNELVVGEPRILVSKEGCPVIIRAFLGKYRYKKVMWGGERKIKDRPDKTHPFSEGMDCVQYAVCYYLQEEFAYSDDDNGEAELEDIRRNQDKNKITGY